MSKSDKEPSLADIRAFCDRTGENADTAKQFFKRNDGYYYSSRNDLLTLQGALDQYYNDSGVKSRIRAREQMEQQLYEVFTKFAKDEDEMSEDTMAAFLIAIGLDPEDDVSGLALAWVLKIATLGVVTKQEFCKGFAWLELGSLDKIKQFAKKLQDRVKQDFRGFYDFCFNLAKETPAAKVADIDTAIAIWQVLQPKVPHFDSRTYFLEYMQDQRPSISFDFWQSQLRFAEHIQDDYSLYSPDDSWNSGIDAYVEWLAARSE